jgi:protein TonB
VSENRFLQSLCALFGAAILVCGVRLFLLATSDGNSVTLEIEPPPATATIAIELSPGSAPAGPVAERDALAPAVAQPTPPAGEPAQTPTSAKDQSQVTTEQQPLIVAEARVGNQVPLASANATTSVEPVTEEKRAVSEPTPEVTAPVLAPGETAVAKQNRGDAAMGNAGDEIAQPDQQSPAPQKEETAVPRQSGPASDGVEQPASLPSAAPQPKPEQPSPPVRLPQRAPKVAVGKTSPKPAVKEKPAPKLGAKTTSPRNPMGLAPAEKPSTTQGQPKFPDANSYSAKIWSALARNKPNAGQRGSTTVTFAIGPAGGIRFARVSQSSGDARLDQLALATVRNAAPFPPPPILKDEPAAYTIRIDFQ